MCISNHIHELVCRVQYVIQHEKSALQAVVFTARMTAAHFQIANTALLASDEQIPAASEQPKGRVRRENVRERTVL